MAKKTKRPATAVLENYHGSRGSNKLQTDGGRYRDQKDLNPGGCGRQHINRTTKK